MNETQRTKEMNESDPMMTIQTNLQEYMISRLSVASILFGRTGGQIVP